MLRSNVCIERVENALMDGNVISLHKFCINILNLSHNKEYLKGGENWQEMNPFHFLIAFYIFHCLNGLTTLNISWAYLNIKEIQNGMFWCLHTCNLNLVHGGRNFNVYLGSYIKWNLIRCFKWNMVSY